MDRIKNIINGSTKKDKYKIRDRFRHLLQSVWFLITNSYFEGFKTGNPYAFSSLGFLLTSLIIIIQFVFMIL
ncbi:hypothetical protein POG14_22240, partial [Clostridium paraputrificum]|nr:hypothetical protein [Clostridium paraputrificum]